MITPFAAFSPQLKVCGYILTTVQLFLVRIQNYENAFGFLHDILTLSCSNLMKLIGRIVVFVMTYGYQFES